MPLQCRRQSLMLSAEKKPHLGEDAASELAMAYFVSKSNQTIAYCVTCKGRF